MSKGQKRNNREPKKPRQANEGRRFRSCIVNNSSQTRHFGARQKEVVGHRGSWGRG